MTLVRHVVRHGDTPSGHGVTLAVLILRAWGGVFRCIFAVVIPSDLSGGGRGELATLAVRLGCSESGAELEAYRNRPTPERVGSSNYGWSWSQSPEKPQQVMGGYE